MANHSWKGRGQVTWTIFILVRTNHISGTAEARVAKGYVKSQHTDDKSPLKSVVRVTWPTLNFVALNNISEIAAAGIVKFCMHQVDYIKY